MFERTPTRRSALSHAATALAGATGLGVIDPTEPSDATDSGPAGGDETASPPGAADGVTRGGSVADGDDCESSAVTPDIAVVGARRTESGYEARAGEVVTFDASESSASAPIDRFEWELGRDRATSDRVHHVWERGGGVAPIELTVTDVRGRSASTTVQVAILERDRYESAPTPVHDVSPARTYDDGYIVQANEVVTFDARDSRDRDGEVVECTWGFRYGAKHGAVVEHAFRRPGNYEVALTVTDDDGHSETVPIPVHVNR